MSQYSHALYPKKGFTMLPPSSIVALTESDIVLKAKNVYKCTDLK